MNKLFLIIVILFSSPLFSMQDPKNMSREQLEAQLKQAQKTIAEQKQTIAVQHYAFDLVWNLNYGNDFQRASAQADLKQIKILERIKYN